MAQAFIRISLEIRRLCIEDWKYDAPEFCSALLHFSASRDQAEPRNFLRLYENDTYDLHPKAPQRATAQPYLF